MDDESPFPATVLSVEELADRLCLMAGRLAAAECEFLELLAEFDAREGWAVVGVRSAAHWLSWRCGMTLGAARERVRVARALTYLPQVRDAFRAGRLSYCKVRALTRVATDATEPELLEIALGATGAQLERVVRSWRTTVLAEMSASSHVRRGFTRRAEADGSVLYTLRVAPEDAAVVDAAVAAARAVVLDADGRPVETPEESVMAAELTDDPPIVRASADAVVLLAESFLTNGALDDTSDVRRVVIHADLEALTSVTDAAPSPATPPPAHATAPTSAADDPVDVRARRGRPASCSVEGGSALAPSTVLRHLCQASAQVMLRAADDHPLDLGRSARHASAKQRAALRVRDGGCCRFPSCTQTHRLIPHHVEWWSRGGRTDLDSLILLCPTHHRAVHELGYSILALGRGRFRFFTPRGSSIPEAPGQRSDGRAQLATAGVDETTIQPMWGGEHLDLELVIWALSGNALNRAGHHLPSLPDRDLPAALRAAVHWPPGSHARAA